MTVAEIQAAALCRVVGVLGVIKREAGYIHASLYRLGDFLADLRKAAVLATREIVARNNAALVEHVESPVEPVAIGNFGPRRLLRQMLCKRRLDFGLCETLDRSLIGVLVLFEQNFDGLVENIGKCPRAARHLRAHERANVVHEIGPVIVRAGHRDLSF